MNINKEAAAIRYNLDDFLSLSKDFDRILTQGDISLIQKWIEENQKRASGPKHPFPFWSIVQNFINESESGFRTGTGVRLRPPARMFPVISSLIVILCFFNVMIFLTALILSFFFQDPFYLSLIYGEDMLEKYTEKEKEDKIWWMLYGVTALRGVFIAIGTFLAWRLSKFVWSSYNDGRYFYIAKGVELPSAQPRNAAKYRIAGSAMLVLAVLATLDAWVVFLLIFIGAAYYCFQRANFAETPDGKLLLNSDTRQPIAFLRSFEEEDTFLVRNEFRSPNLSGY